MTQFGIFYRISFYFVQVFFGSYEMRNSKKNWVSPTQIFWFSIISNHGIFMFFHRKCMENGQKRLFLALKRCFLEKFSTDFFLSLICVIYVSKDLKSVKKQGVTTLNFGISLHLMKNYCKLGQRWPPSYTIARFLSLD